MPRGYEPRRETPPEEVERVVQETLDRAAASERRVPVNGMRGYTIAWWEHRAAWRCYEGRLGQDAETVARRGGFGLNELIAYLGHGPATIEPADLTGIERMRASGARPRVGDTASQDAGT